MGRGRRRAPLVPARAGTQITSSELAALDSRLRGNERPLLATRYSPSPPRYHLTDRTDVVRGKEQAPVRQRGDGARAATFDRKRVFADELAVRRHTADFVGKILGEPKIAIGRHGDAAQ